MICNNCGVSLNSTAKFCPSCGVSVSQLGGASTLGDPGSRASTSLVPVAEAILEPPVSQSFFSYCVTHTSMAAAGNCSGCRNAGCRDCLVNHGGVLYCRSCVMRFSAQAANISPYQYQNAPAYGAPPFQQYQYAPPAPPYLPQMMGNPYMRPIKRKEPAVALLLSFFLPGVGQLYNGDVGKGIGLMIGFWVLIWLFGIGVVFWIWSMIDAYQSATNINLGRRI